MGACFFVSDLHGVLNRYERLFGAIADETPEGVFMGGDILGHALTNHLHRSEDFVRGFLIKRFQSVREYLGPKYPQVFLILGNDDARSEESGIKEGEDLNLWRYLHMNRAELGAYSVYGYNYCPPSPYQLKDWERYDVSRFTDPGCVSPEQGIRSVPVPMDREKFATIKKDLAELLKDDDLSRSIVLFHTPPYRTLLDRAALDGKMIDHAPADVHVGSIAVKEMIETRQPLLTLHGHIHESPGLTGGWKEQIGRTIAISAAHDGPELALIRFDPENPHGATRTLI